MDRLTYWHNLWRDSKKIAYLKGGLDAAWSKKLKKHKYEIIINAIQRLAAYEDTGLEPDEIPHWIPCNEKLPETDGENTHAFDVLVYVPKRDGCSQNGYYLGKLHKVEADNAGNKNFWGIKTPGSKWTLWGWSYFEKPIPSHWMPLPKPPKGAK